MTFTVYGTPAPQGSKRHVGRGIMIESSAKVKPWREAVKWAALEARGAGKVMFSGPIEVRIDFYLARPKSAPKSVTRPAKCPDLDKLIRSTLDGLTESGLIEDDSRVVSISANKEFGQPRAEITVALI